MRISDAFLTELKSRIRPSDVMGRKVKLKKQGKEWAGLSPFTNEKTPSFYVNDEKGFFKCFSSGKFGDVITFLIETEKLSFMEAVERLAGEAGMEIPKGSEEDVRAFQQRKSLLDWMEAATQFFEDQLRAQVGRDARDYLERRGLGPDAWPRHRIGFAPEGWRNILDYLTELGATPEEIIAAGLAIDIEENDKPPYDRFRNRIIFPILDPSGRPIALGGRTINPEGKPKYLNSPETSLFHKGRVLYRYGPAREALATIGKGALAGTPLSRGLVVTEGYVDAIALAEAGIGTGVAPLGTALTEEQLDLLWRVGPEPILCFDGDAAGVRAAHKAVDRALPYLEPGRSLFFTLLPDGMDPDDMIRRNGATAMKDALVAAKPLVDLLWTRELNFEPLNTPERRAGLEARLNACVEAIQHTGVKAAYGRELRDRLFQHFRSVGQGGRKRNDERRPRAGVNRAIGPVKLAGLQCLARAIDSPALLEAGSDQLAIAYFEDQDISALRDAVLDVLDSRETLDRSAVASHLRSLGRTRSEKLLKECSLTEPVDLATAEGREWLSALERFPTVAALRDEAERTSGAFASADGVEEQRAEWARRQRLVAERQAMKTRLQDASDGADHTSEA